MCLTNFPKYKKKILGRLVYFVINSKNQYSAIKTDWFSVIIVYGSVKMMDILI